MKNPNLSFLNEVIPTYIVITFLLTAILTMFLLIRAIHKSGYGNTKQIDIGLAIWIFLQAILAESGFYTNISAFPPHFPMAIILPLLLIILLFSTKSGKQFIDSLSLENLTYLHIVRIPVEICLFWLFLEKQVPQLMTFEGRNFDILSGISAPIIAFLVFKKQILSKKVLLLWNFLGLILLINIVTNAALSAPIFTELFAFEQPNVAVLKFPIIWLPSFIVPVVLFAHLASIRQIFNEKKVSNP
jgi:hypothetical protein